jgi:hypothetical protein
LFSAKSELSFLFCGEALAFLALHLLLGCDCTAARTLTGTGVGVGALAANWQVAAVTDSAIGLISIRRRMFI